MNAPGKINSLILRHSSDASEIEDVADMSRKAYIPHSSSNVEKNDGRPAKVSAKENIVMKMMQIKTIMMRMIHSQLKSILVEYYNFASGHFERKQERRNRNRGQTAQQAARHIFELEKN